MLTFCTRSLTGQLKARLAEGEHIAFCAGSHNLYWILVTCKTSPIHKNFSLLEKALFAAKEAFETGELAASVAPEQVFFVPDLDHLLLGLNIGKDLCCRL